jgi:hypothetical protein
MATGVLHLELAPVVFLAADEGRYTPRSVITPVRGEQ